MNFLMSQKLSLKKQFIANSESCNTRHVLENEFLIKDNKPSSTLKCCNEITSQVLTKGNLLKITLIKCQLKSYFEQVFC